MVTVFDVFLRSIVDLGQKIEYTTQGPRKSDKALDANIELREHYRKNPDFLYLMLPRVEHPALSNYLSEDGKHAFKPTRGVNDKSIQEQNRADNANLLLEFHKLNTTADYIAKERLGMVQTGFGKMVDGHSVKRGRIPARKNPRKADYDSDNTLMSDSEFELTSGIN
jgi:hypothetical protein